MNNNFDLKKFLKENKSIERANPYIIKEDNEKNQLRKHINKLIREELNEMGYGAEDETEDDDYSDYFFDIDTPEDIDEAKKKKKKDKKEEEEETPEEEMPDEVEDSTEEDIDIEGSEEDPLAAGEIEADELFSSDEQEVINNIVNALKSAEKLDNPTLTTQIANTLKYAQKSALKDEQ